MCGLVGMAGNISKEDRNMFRSLLIVDTIRGHHSTGVAAATAKGDLSVFKKAVPAIDLVQMKAYEDVVDYNSQVLIGHNRWATVGRVNNITAHPFHIGSTVGAHNGTLTGWYNLPDAKDFDVDSECLIHNIHHHGWEKTVALLDGAYALTVYDTDDHSLHIIRNKERPLYIASKNTGDVVYWASEAWMLRSMAARHNVKIQEVWQPKEHTLFSWDLPENKHNGALSPPKKVTLEATAEKKQWPAPYVRPKDGSARSGASNYSTDSRYSTSALSAELGVGSGEIIEIYPVEVKRAGVSNSYYLEAVMMDEPWSEIRVYGQKKLFEEYVEENCILEGTVCSLVRGQNGEGAYAICNQVDYLYETEEEDSMTLAEGPGGKMVDEKEFNELAKYGCGMCSSDLSFTDVVYWQGQSPICEDCDDAAAALIAANHNINETLKGDN